MTNAQTKPAIVDLTKIASIDDLFLALRASFQGARIEVTDKQDRVFKLHILGVTHEDGSGRSFSVTGYAQLTRTPRMRISGMGSSRFEAYMNYKGGGRKGWIEILD